MNNDNLSWQVMILLDDIATTLNWKENIETVLDLINKFRIGTDEERFDEIVDYLSNKYNIPIM